MKRHSTSGSLGWVLSRLVAQGLEFCGWILLARRLGASGVGVLAVAAIVARMLGLIGDWGASFRGPRDVVVKGRDSEAVVALVRRRQQVTIVLTAAMVLGAIVSGHAAVAPMALAVAARGAGRDWVALGESRRRDAAVPLLVQGALVCAGVLLTSSVFSGACAIAVGHFMGLIVSIRLNPIMSGRSLGRVVVDSWYLLAGIADQVLVSSDTILLALMRTTAEAGVYASVYRLPLAWITVIGLCTTAAVPIVTDGVRSGRILGSVAHQRADWAALALTAALVPVAIVGLVVVGPLFGGDFVVGRSALLILFVATAATTASAPYRVLYTAFGSDRRVGLITTIAAFVNFIANIAVIGRWGMEGAAATTLLTQVGMLVFFASWSVKARRPVVSERARPLTV